MIDDTAPRQDQGSAGADPRLMRDLARANSRLSALITNLQAAILVEDEERRVVLANPAFCRMFGVPVGPEQLVGADCAAMAEQARDAFVDPQAFVDRIQELLERRVLVEGDELRLKDGRVLLRDFIPVDVGGEGLGHLWQYRDVTDRRYEEALHRAMIGTALDGIVTIDHEGRVLEFNRAAEEIFGHRREDVLGREMGAMILPERFREAHAAGMRRYNETREPHVLGQRIELAALRADGTEFPVELSINVIPGSEPPLFTGFLRDITSEKQRERELQEAKDLAEEASKAKSEFLAIMSHEIRTPMNAILGMTELSLDAATQPDQRTLLQTVRSNAESLLHVINDVLDFSKMEAGQLALRDEIFSVADVVESVAEVLAPRAFEKGLELSCSIDPSLSGAVVGDPNRIRQILVNLLGNAVKFTEEGWVSVDVGTADTEGEALTVRLSVSDSGIGISERELARVFDPFFQADASLSREFGGTGLGLGICRSLTDLMGGRIWAESTPGKGSAFHVELPLRRSEQGFARRRASDLTYERWRAWVVSPYDGIARGVIGALSSVGIPTGRTTAEELASRLVADATPGLQQLVVADQQLGLTTLQSVAESTRSGELPGSVRLCVLVPPGPLDPWRVEGPVRTSYVAKPATRRKLVGVVYASVEDTTAAVAPEVREKVEGPPAHLLLVEDNADNRAYALRVLQEAGYRVDVAEDGAEGLQRALACQYDLIISDLEMPVMDGFEMTREILTRQGPGRNVPILAFTAHAVEGFRERCLEAGMVGYVAKPVRRDALKAAVREALRARPLVLVVDDSEDSREIVRRFLGDEPVRVATASGGREAIEQVRRGGASLVLLDMNMPGIDGYETARRIRALPGGGSIPILAMTSWVGAEEEARCLEAGCTAYLAKPLRREDLVAAVRELAGTGSASPERHAPDEGPVEVDPSIADLIPEYLESRRSDAVALREHLGRGELEAIRVLAHNLAGSGEPYGFPRLSELGRTLEAVATDGEPDDVLPWLDELEAYLSSVRWVAAEEA